MCHITNDDYLKEHILNGITIPNTSVVVFRNKDGQYDMRLDNFEKDDDSSFLHDDKRVYVYDVESVSSEHLDELFKTGDERKALMTYLDKSPTSYHFGKHGRVDAISKQSIIRFDHPVALKCDNLKDYIQKYSNALNNAEKDNLTDRCRNIHWTRIAYTMTVDLISDKNYGPFDDKTVDDISTCFGITPDENGIYYEGIRFTPMIACDKFYYAGMNKAYHTSPTRYRISEYVPYPYIYTYKGDDKKMHHDSIIDPSYAVDIIKGSNYTVKDNCISGVCRGSIVKHNDIDLSSDKYTDGDIDRLYPTTSFIYGNPLLHRLDSILMKPEYDVCSGGGKKVSAFLESLEHKDGKTRDFGGYSCFDDHYVPCDVDILTGSLIEDYDINNVLYEIDPFDEKRHNSFVKFSQRVLHDYDRQKAIANRPLPSVNISMCNDKEESLFEGLPFDNEDDEDDNDPMFDVDDDEDDDDDKGSFELSFNF